MTPVPRFKFLIGTTLLLIALINCGCTAGLRKARYSKQAERYFKAGQYDEAKVEYIKLLRIDPQNAAAYARMGQITTRRGARTSLFIPSLDRLAVAVRANDSEPAAVWIYRPLP